MNKPKIHLMENDLMFQGKFIYKEVKINIPIIRSKMNGF